MKKKLCLLVFLLLFGLSTYAAEDGDYQLKVVKVLEVTETQREEFKEQIVKVKILDKDFDKGPREFFVVNNVPNSKAFAINAEVGRKYLVAFDRDVEDIYISDYYREPTVFFLIALFVLLIIIFGGTGGLKAILSLVLTGIAIIYYFIPGIKEGQDPLTLAVFVAAFSTATTMSIIAGFTRKSLAATIGTTGGVAAAGLIAAMAIKTAPLSGLASTEAYILLGNMPDANLNFQGILAAGVLISSLGAAMDVAISIASSTQEIYEVNHRQSKRELFAHAMNVGRDIMGTMTNTLILAYTGASIPLFLLLYNESGLRILNMEIIAAELCGAIVGSIGLLLAIPITATASVFLLKTFNSPGYNKAHG